VIVVGEFKQGKSKLINALVNAPVCPVDDDIATSVPTVVRYGDSPSAVIVVRRDDDSALDDDQALERRPVELEKLPSYVSERGNPGNRRRLVAAEVFLPRKILSRGLAIVDSPGVGGLDSAHALTTLTALPTADAMILVSDASQEYTEPELRFLRQALRVCPNVACVVSKTDLYPMWRQVVDLDRGHLDRQNLPGRDGSAIPLLPVSSDLRLEASRLRDTELNTESGFPSLVAYLETEILGRAELLQRRSVAQDLLSVTEQLKLSLQSELGALEDPAGTAQRIIELEAAKAKADEQRRGRSPSVMASATSFPTWNTICAIGSVISSVKRKWPSTTEIPDRCGSKWWGGWNNAWRLLYQTPSCGQTSALNGLRSWWPSTSPRTRCRCRYCTSTTPTTCLIRSSASRRSTRGT
jgi:hypothetical protein